MLHRNYKASGKAPAAGLILFVILGLIGCSFAEAVYVYLLGFVSNLFLRGLVIAGCILSLSWWLILLTRIGKLRNPVLVRVLGLAVFIVAYYLGRCVYVNLVQDFWSVGSAEVETQLKAVSLPVANWLKLLVSPGTVGKALLRILPYGVFSINGWMVKGIPLMILWLVEIVLVIVIPYLILAYYAGRPYDEELMTWLPRREEWAVTYVPNYREIRSQMRHGNCAALLDALKDLSAYRMQGQESYAVLEFYTRGSYIGPYVSLTNVKAVQSGPRKLDHRLVRMCRLFDIGVDEAKKLHDRIEDSYHALKKSGEGQKLSDKLSMAHFTLNREAINMATEIRQQKQYSQDKDEQFEVKPVETVATDTLSAAELYSTETIPTVEDVSIHVPRVTPEMEQEYLNRQKEKKK